MFIEERNSIRDKWNRTSCRSQQSTYSSFHSAEQIPAYLTDVGICLWVVSLIKHLKQTTTLFPLLLPFPKGPINRNVFYSTTHSAKKHQPASGVLSGFPLMLSLIELILTLTGACCFHSRSFCLSEARESGEYLVEGGSRGNFILFCKQKTDDQGKPWKCVPTWWITSRALMDTGTACERSRRCFFSTTLLLSSCRTCSHYTVRERAFHSLKGR